MSDSLLLSLMFEEYLYLANAQTTSHNIMSRTNREQSSPAMATTNEVQGSIKKYTPTKKTESTFLYLGKYKAFVRNVLKIFRRA